MSDFIPLRPIQQFYLNSKKTMEFVVPPHSNFTVPDALIFEPLVID